MAVLALRSGCSASGAHVQPAQCLEPHAAPGTTAPTAAVTCCASTEGWLPADAKPVCPGVCRNAQTAVRHQLWSATGVNGSNTTWAEAEAECLAHGRVVCSQAELEHGAGCAFHDCRRRNALLWTRSSCGTDVKPTPQRHTLGFQPLRRAGTCATKSLDLTGERTSSFAECMERCNATTRCKTVAYNFRFRVCKLQALCVERYHLSTGQCEHWWMMRPIEDRFLWTLFPQTNLTNFTEFCYFTHGPTSQDGTTLRRRRRHAAAWRYAQNVRANEELFPRANATVCNRRPLLAADTTGTVINVTYNRGWRYFTALQCGNSSAPSICLTFKTEGRKAVLGHIISRDGRAFSGKNEVLRLPEPWREHMLTHNAALLRLEHDDYVLMGGMQGFFYNRSCLRRLTRNQRRPRSACLTMNSGNETANTPDAHGHVQSSRPGATGIKLTRGIGLPWGLGRWSTPHTVITGNLPAGCIDRRPTYTGYPRLAACQFDGRLSLTTHRGRYLLYSRANLRLGVVAGGRAVQVTQSDHLDVGWKPWQLVHLDGVDRDERDIYFFAVQANPVDPSSLLAIFPLTEPPLACIALAVSYDGVRFSRPINVRQSKFGVRTHDKNGQRPTRLEWRGEDHPAAGLVWDPGQGRSLLLYVHVAVKGTTIRQNAISHVRVFNIAADELARETTRGLHSLSVL